MSTCFLKSFFSFLEFGSFLLFVDRLKKTFYLQNVLPSFLLIQLEGYGFSFHVGMKRKAEHNN